MKKSILIFTLLGCLSFLIGCGSTDSTPQTVELKTLFPLTIGNYWLYSEKMFNENTGELTDTNTTPFYIKTDTIYNGHAGVQLIVGDDRDILYYYGDSLFFSKSSYFRAQLMIIYPMKKGDMVVAADTINTISNYHTRTELWLIDDHASVSVPAGTFVTLQYRTIVLGAPNGSPLDTTKITDNFYTSGVGLVKSTGKDRADDGVLRQTLEVVLKSYMLK